MTENLSYVIIIVSPALTDPNSAMTSILIKFSLRFDIVFFSFLELKWLISNEPCGMYKSYTLIIPLEENMEIKIIIKMQTQPSKMATYLVFKVTFDHFHDISHKLTFKCMFKSLHDFGH